MNVSMNTENVVLITLDGLKNFLSRLDCHLTLWVNHTEWTDHET